LSRVAAVVRVARQETLAVVVVRVDIALSL